MYKILQRYLRLQNVSSTGDFRLALWGGGRLDFRCLESCLWVLGGEPGTMESGNIALFGLVILLQIKWKNFKNFLRLVLSVVVVVSFLYVGFSLIFQLFDGRFDFKIHTFPGRMEFAQGKEKCSN